MKIQIRKQLILIIASSLAFALPAAKSASPDNREGLKLCQLMQMDRPGLGKLESVDAPPRVETKEAAAAGSAPIDVTPVMSWISQNENLKAIIVCIHGLGLNKGSYAKFGERLAKDGYGVYAMDVRGFGEFQQLPGDRRCNFKKCLEDVYEALRLARKMHPGAPLIVLGESMGGAIAMRVTEEHPELLDGLISSVPGASRLNQLQSSLQVGFKLITGGLHAKVNVGKSVVERSTEKQDLREKWSNDPLARFVLTPAELIQFQNFMETNKKNAFQITRTPVLMVQGAKDKLVKSELEDEGLSTFGKIRTEDKSLVMVAHAEHLIFEEGQFDEDDVKLVMSWITEHFPAKDRSLRSSAAISPTIKAE